jgi:2-dehydro-3-deoxyphosphogluconate aldolase/(4S)-4-hydroxy-2-oxoglutarate aldolase
MENLKIYPRIGTFCVVPVIAIENADDALPLADALLEGGLPLAEITFRTAAAARVIAILASRRPEILLGAGTLLNTEDLRQAAGCGATFGVAPGFNPEVAREALRIGFPFSPGIMTPSDIEGAVGLGIKVLKFFPAGASGGVKMLRSIAGPYAHLGVRFIPTGGINLNNMKDYIEESSVLAVGGTWIATREDIAAARWATIRENCRAALAMVEQLRRPAQMAH